MGPQAGEMVKRGGARIVQVCGAWAQDGKPVGPPGPGMPGNRPAENDKTGRGGRRGPPRTGRRGPSRVGRRPRAEIELQRRRGGVPPHQRGEEHGLRPPTAIERARAAGLEHYYTALGLTGRQLYDTVGLAFDGRALQRRLWPLIRAWANDTATRAPPCPDAWGLMQIFRQLDPVIQRHAPLAPRATAPFPPDLMDRWAPPINPHQLRITHPTPPVWVTRLGVAPGPAAHTRDGHGDGGEHTAASGMAGAPLP